MEGRNLLEKYLAKFESNFETGIHVVNNIGLCITFSMMGFDWFSYFWTILRKEKKNCKRTITLQFFLEAHIFQISMHVKLTWKVSLCINNHVTVIGPKLLIKKLCRNDIIKLLRVLVKSCRYFFEKKNVSFFVLIMNQRMKSCDCWKSCTLLQPSIQILMFPFKKWGSRTMTPATPQ